MPDTLASMGVHLGPNSTARLLSDPALSDARLHALARYIESRGMDVRTDLARRFGSLPDQSHRAVGHDGTVTCPVCGHRFSTLWRAAESGLDRVRASAPDRSRSVAAQKGA